MIDGVKIKQLKPIYDERGHVMELLRSDWPEFKNFGQAYLTTAYPGVVKAMIRDEEERRELRQKEKTRMGLKLGGLITMVVGVALAVFLYYLIDDEPIYLVGLIPLLVVDELSLACWVGPDCTAEGVTAGHVVRWHRQDVDPAKQLRRLDVDALEYVESVEAELAARGKGLSRVLDEIGPASHGVLPDADDPDHDAVRHHALWGNLMAGGGGCEWYFGYEYAHNADDAVAAQDYLGVDRVYYRPVDRGFEAEIARRLEQIRAKLREAKAKSKSGDGS